MGDTVLIRVSRRFLTELDAFMGEATETIYGPEEVDAEGRTFRRVELIYEPTITAFAVKSDPDQCAKGTCDCL